MDLSVIIPVYNSERIVEGLVNKIIDSLSKISVVKKYEILLIDDSSPDHSWIKIKTLCSKYNFVKGIKLKENFGQHNSLLAGMNLCTGNVIITMDDDLQHSPESIIKLLTQINNGFDVCYTNYLNRKHPVWKRIVSWLNNLVSSYLLNRPYKLYLSSFRAIKKEIVNEIIKYKGSSVYIDSLILKTTRNITITPVEHYERPHGKSNYNFSKLISLWSDMAVDFPVSPLKISTFFGIIIKFFIITYRKIFLKKKYNKPLFVIQEKTF